MNVAEGSRRMQYAGRWLFFAPVVAAIVSVGLAMAVAYLPSGANFGSFGVLGVFPLLLPIALMGALLWLAGWILEGFIKSKEDH
ncbi:MAG: hypothetical protein WBQ94_08420 [Terracidiphilus sp.]